MSGFENQEREMSKNKQMELNKTKNLLLAKETINEAKGYLQTLSDRG